MKLNSLKFEKITKNLSSEDRGLRKVDVLVVCIIAGVIFTLIRGYRFGVGNQIETIPQEMRGIDSTYLVNDFLVNATDRFGPRFFFVKFIAALAQIAPLPIVHLILTFANNVLVALITAFSARKLFKESNFAGMLVCSIVLSVDSIDIGGSGSLVNSVLIPHFLAIPFALAAVGFGILRRPVLVAVFSGISSLFHPSVGLEVGTVVLLAILVTHFFHRVGLGRKSKGKEAISILKALLVFAVFVAVWLLPYSQQYKMSTGQFISFLVAAGVGWYLWQKQQKVSFYRRTVVLFIFIFTLVLFLGGYLFVEVLPIRLWVTAHTFRLVFLIKWLGLVLVGGVIANLWQAIRNTGDTFDVYLLLIGLLRPVTMGIVLVSKVIRSWVRNYNQLLGSYLEAGPVLLVIVAYLLYVSSPQPMSFLLFLILIFTVTWLEKSANRTRIMWLFFGLTVILLVFLLGPRTPSILKRLKPIVYLSDLSGEEVEIANYARENTPSQAIFLTPPDYGTFRIVAQRAMVADFKSVPMYDRAIIEWYTRLVDSYGGSSFEEFQSNYKEIDDNKLKMLRGKYGISYAILDRETLTELPILYESSNFKLVQIRDVKEMLDKIFH
jgi:hypothetical protein